MDGVVIPNKLRTDGITFVIGKADLGRMMQGRKADQFYPARLTVRVWKGEHGCWHGIVSSVESIPPTPRQLNERPEDFVGQTLVFDRVELSASVQRLPGRYGFRLKADGVEFRAIPEGSQKIRFATPDRGDRVSNLLEGIAPGRMHLSRLTVRVEKLERDDYVATVSRIELIRFEEEKPISDEPLATTPEEVVANPSKYSGKLVVFDGLRFTKEIHNGPARTLVGVKTPSGTEFKAVPEGKAFKFGFTGKGGPVKAYIASHWGDDFDQPVRVVGQLAEGGGARLIISRIDRVMEFTAEGK